MGSIRIYKGMPPLTDKQIKELEDLDKREIDLSDIPEITDEEIARIRQRQMQKKNLKIA